MPPQKVPIIQDALLTFPHISRLSSDLLKSAQHLAITLHKAIDLVLDTHLFRPDLDLLAGLAQVMARHGGEQVVDSLELQAAVHPVQPGGAVDVHGGAQLLQGPWLVAARRDGRHSEVGKCELHV